MDNSASKYSIILIYFRKYKIKIIISGVFLIFVTTLELAFPLLMKNIIDRILQKENLLWNISGLCLLSISILLLKELFQYYLSYWARYIGEGVTTELRKNLYLHLLILHLGFFKNRHSGEICSRAINDLNHIQSTLTLDFLYFLKNFLFSIGGLIIIFLLSWKISLIMVSGIIFIALFTVKIGGKMRKISKEIMVKTGKVNTLFQELFPLIKIIQSFGQEKRMINRFAEENKNVFLSSLKEEKIYAGFGALMNFFNPFLLILIIWYGGYEINQGRLTPGTLIGLLFYLYLLADSIRGVSDFHVEFQKSLSSLERISEISSIEPEIKDKPGNFSLPPKIKGYIQFENVSLVYEDNYYALKDINLEITPGDIVTIVGYNGSGKTSLVNLLLHFYEPTNGNIKIDNWNIKDVTIKSLREKIGYIPQEPILFNGSIYENIAFGKKEGATEEEVIQVARIVGIHNLITTLPNKYQTMIGEGGIKLSGGQRQVITILRAILKKPDIFILDEATSSLDPKAEMEIYNKLMNLIRGKTTIIIAHRPGTVINAEKIVVLNQGKIVEVGSHSDLIKERGAYYHLFQKQFKRIEDESPYNLVRAL
ncbi:MAG: ABC transporter ATP-binding protein [bacterium]|nr:ABC transporter ATP-binding protein [bacterium]